MSQLNQADLQQMQRVAADALLSSEAAVSGQAADVDSIRDFFCQHWPMVKQVLQFLGDNIGGVVRWTVRAVIAAGDFLHGRICG